MQNICQQIQYKYYTSTILSSKLSFEQTSPEDSCSRVFLSCIVSWNIKCHRYGISVTLYVTLLFKKVSRAVHQNVTIVVRWNRCRPAFRSVYTQIRKLFSYMVKRTIYIRNYKEEVVAGSSLVLQNLGDSTSAEAAALLHGLQLIERIGCSPVTIDFDSLELVQAFNGEINSVAHIQPFLQIASLLLIVLVIWPCNIVS